VPVPISVEVGDITAPWLGSVLGGRIDAIELLDTHSGTTGRVRVGLLHDDRRLPPSVFVKLAPFASEQRAFVAQTGMGVGEARFYAEIAADVPVRHPRTWYATHDETGRYVMVLEDLTSIGAEFPGQRDPGLLTLVENTIDSFAALHAAFWQSDRFEPGGDLAWVADRSADYGSSADLIGFAVDQLGDQLPEASRELADVYLVRAEHVPNFLGKGPRPLVHGDAHLGNMFTDGATPGLLDWALMGFAPGLRDVAYFLGGSVPTELRRAHERRLVERYCLRLADHGIALDVDEAWDQYRSQLLTAWIAAVFTAGMGSKLQTQEVGMSSTLRADAAICDHHVAERLEAALTQEKFE